ncbi:MAG: alpha-L-fucosidase [Clostridiaceae bacterium]|nr:alpha-L-fucosidase [Clostridiaceae bacterium]
MSYKASWNSLKDHITPKWFKDAKFGIYTHWGVYSVPAYGPNVTWYPYNMYREGTPQYEYHVKTYGHPSKFGYKDFIPMFKGEKFDADEWAELFRKAGAQFVGPVGEHHDGFSMWDTQYSKWNAARMGPKRDIVGELERAIRKQNMRFMVALHHAENWWFFPHWKKEYDTSDPSYTGLYGELHNQEWGESGLENKERNDEWALQDKPSKEFLDRWLAKTIEVIDKYQPDMLWFDFGLRYVQEHYKRELLAYYYNKAKEWDKEVVVTYKWHDMAPGSGVIDLELGRYDQLTYHEWITDTTVDDGCAWGYMLDARYKTPDVLIHYLVDNVSKNGLMLLNVVPKPNGEIPEEAKEILLEIGKWLEVNGEAIYGTTPWMVYGEGPTHMTKAGYFSEEQEVRYTAKDIRFTVKDDILYAICLGWPEHEVIIRTIGEKLYESEIASVRMLGIDEELSWRIIDNSLIIKTPDKKPCDYAYVFKIERKHPFK